MESEKLRRSLEGFIGTEAYHKIFPFKTVFTDGVKYFAEQAGAFWLITDINLFLHKSELGKQDFLSIKLVVQENKRADLIFDDGNDNVLFKRHYRFTDCPAGEWKFFYMDGVLMLPSEY